MIEWSKEMLALIHELHTQTVLLRSIYQNGNRIKSEDMVVFLSCLERFLERILK